MPGMTQAKEISIATTTTAPAISVAIPYMATSKTKATGMEIVGIAHIVQTIILFVATIATNILTLKKRAIAMIVANTVRAA